MSHQYVIRVDAAGKCRLIMGPLSDACIADLSSIWNQDALIRPDGITSVDHDLWAQMPEPQRAVVSDVERFYKNHVVSP